MQATAEQVHGMVFRAMGSRIGVYVTSDDSDAATAHLNAAWALVMAVEAQLSRFRADSELSRLNAAPGRPVEVSPLLWQVLSESLDAARRTQGIFDCTVIDALEAAGYDRTFEAVPDSDAETSSPACRNSGACWRDIRMDAANRTVTLPSGVRLDVGGIAKGWTAQRAVEILAQVGPSLVDAGGDIACVGKPPGSEGWTVGVASPFEPNSDLAVLSVCDRGVATSGTDYRRWWRRGVLQHHIIDPRTRRPANSDLVSVTVVASDAAQADVHAKVALVLGSEQGYEYLVSQSQVEALLVRLDGTAIPTPDFKGCVTS